MDCGVVATIARPDLAPAFGERLRGEAREQSDALLKHLAGQGVLATGLHPVSALDSHRSGWEPLPESHGEQHRRRPGRPVGRQECPTPYEGADMTERLRPRDLALLATESPSTPMHNATVEIFEPGDSGFDHSRLVELMFYTHPPTHARIDAARTWARMRARSSRNPNGFTK